MKQGCHSEEKYQENEIVFQVRKIQGISKLVREIWKSLEKSDNLKEKTCIPFLLKVKGGALKRDSPGTSASSWVTTLNGKNFAHPYTSDTASTAKVR